MRLITLGGLELEGSGLKSPQPLLLLAYLALEGPQTREHLWEMFWWDAVNPKNNLSSTLTRIRQKDKTLIEADNKKVSTTLDIDAKDLLDCLEQNDIAKAEELYQGTFLTGFKEEGLGEDLSKWIETYRGYLADNYRSALLGQANKHHSKNEHSQAGKLAESAFRVGAGSELEPEDYQRIYSYLKLSDNPLAKTVLEEAEELELKLSEPLSEEELLKREIPKDIPNNLKPSKTKFIGRDQELIEIAAYLGRPDCRLLTLHGMGGTGKTRLVEQVAQEQLNQMLFQDGIYFVALESVNKEILFLSTIANSMNINLQFDTDILNQICDFIKNKRILIVLDNFEHLISSSSILELVISRCTNLKLLVTSRVSLRIEAEWIMPITGMNYPETSVSLHENIYFEAIQLFVQSARKAFPNFNVNEESFPHLCDLCHSVRGLPLALELASAWVNIMSIEELASEIKSSNDLLVRQGKRKISRHGNIDVVFEHSWIRLTDQEKFLLRGLAVFKGGFSRAAAMQVTGISTYMLLSFVSKSLIQSFEHNTFSRFVIHPLIHSYINGYMSTESTDFKLRHSNYFLDLLVSLENIDNETAIEKLDLEFANIEQAWGFVAKHLDSEKLKVFLKTLLYFGQGPKIRLGIELFEQTIKDLENRGLGNTRLQGEFYINSAWLNQRIENFIPSLSQAQKAIEISITKKDNLMNMKGHNIVGWIHYHEYRHNSAKDSFETAVHLASKEQSDFRKALYLSNLALILSELGEFQKAETAFKFALQTFREFNMVYNEIPLLLNFAKHYNEYDQPKKAIFLLDKARVAIEETKFITSLPTLLLHKAESFFLLGRLEDSVQIINQATSDDDYNLATDVRIALTVFLGRISLEKNDVESAISQCITALNLASGPKNKCIFIHAVILMSECMYYMDNKKSACKVIRFLMDNYILLTSHQNYINQVSKKCACVSCEYSENTVRNDFEMGHLDVLEQPDILEFFLERGIKT